MKNRRKKDIKTDLYIYIFSHTHTHTHTLPYTNEVNEDECEVTVLLTSCVSNCGPVLQGHGGKTSREWTKIDLMRRKCGTVVRLRKRSLPFVFFGVAHN